MDRHTYNQFTTSLLANLEADERVIGLVAAGSMANTDHAPDEWSDHDFWIVTIPGAQGAFRHEYNWLPDSDQIALVFQETEHGFKVVYHNGHLLEYAVFDVEEIKLAKANSARILLDRERIAERLARAQDETANWSAEQRQDEAYLFGQFITNLQVGVGRHARGEHLSGHMFVRAQAITHLLPLLGRYGAVYETKYNSAPNVAMLDNIDPLRRFEYAFPVLGREVNEALQNPTPQAAAMLLALADRVLGDRMPAYSAPAVEAIQHVINKANNSST